MFSIKQNTQMQQARVYLYSQFSQDHSVIDWGSAVSAVVLQRIGGSTPGSASPCRCVLGQETWPIAPVAVPTVCECVWKLVTAGVQVEP